MKLELIEYVHENLSHGFVPYFIYSMIVDDVEVGRLTLREGTDDQCYYEGHIGYSVHEEFRGHYYAYQACIELAKIMDQDHLIMTCDPKNIASQKTIKRLGCQYKETQKIPTHLRKFFTKDEKEKMIFIWKIKR